ncbi:hypothetical protein Tco_0396167 [Tanacetum coccineum]
MTKAQDQRSHSMKEQAYNKDKVQEQDSRTQRQDNIKDLASGEIVSLKSIESEIEARSFSRESSVVILTDGADAACFVIFMKQLMSCAGFLMSLDALILLLQDLCELMNQKFPPYIFAARRCALLGCSEMNNMVFGVIALALPE